MTHNAMTDPRSALSAILAALPGTCVQLGQRAGVNRGTPLRWMNKLRGKGVYISGWTTDRNPRAIWAKGNLPDAEFKGMTGAQMNKRYRDKLRKSGEYDFMRAKRRAHYHADKYSKQPPQGIFAALFGKRPVQQGGQP
jgi:hypothetical protein